MRMLVFVVSLLSLGFTSTVQAQDPCDSYHDKYRICVEIQNEGRQMDYNVCKSYTDETTCEAGGCTWYVGNCMIDICLTEVSGDDKITSPDYAVFKKEFGRSGCPSTPDIPAKAPVEWSGAMQCWDENGTERISCTGTGEDAEYQTGVHWPLPRFMDNGDGSLTDKVTGLTWLEDANCIATNYPGFDNDFTAGDGTVTWQHALDFVAGINDGTYPLCGASKTDWRLPNIKELLSLIDYSQQSPALPFLFTLVVDNEMSANYWSSTTCVITFPTPLYAYAWLVDMDSGIVGSGYKHGGTYVWPVRGGND